MMLIALGGILVGATSVEFVNTVRHVQLRIDKTKALFLAQAGLMQALQDWISSGSDDTTRRYSEENVTVTGNQIFKTGAQANFAHFRFDGTPPYQWTSPGGQDRLRRWQMRNIHASDTITVKALRVSWNPTNAVNLRSVSVNNGSSTTVIVPTGSYPSGTLITLTTPYDISSGTLLSGSNTYLEWTGSLPDPIQVNVQWTFQDDSAVKDSKTHNVLFWNGAKNGNGCGEAGLGAPCARTFSITSSGQVNQSGGLAFKVLETVKATISTAPAAGPEIMDLDRVKKNIT